MPKEKFRISIDKKYGEKHGSLDMGDVIVNYMAEDSENKIDSRRFVGLDGNIQNTDLKELLYRSDFVTERAKIGQKLSLYGEAFIALILIDNKWMISFFKPITYEVIKTKVIQMDAEGIGTKTLSGNMQSPIYYRWKVREDGRVIRETYYYQLKFPGDKKAPRVVDSEFVYPKNVTQVPGILLRNNPSSTPDWYNVGDMLSEINVFSNDISEEWEFIKTQFQNNGMFGRGEQGVTREEAIKNGSRIHDMFSPNGKFAQAFQAIISGSTTITTLIQTVVFLEDRALKYAFSGRDSDSSGSNKHNLQVGLFSQANSEYIQKKIEQRQRDYMRFFKDVVQVITGIKAPNKIEIQASEFETGKIEGMKSTQAQRELYQAQAQQQKSTASRNKAQATVIDSKQATTVSKTETDEQPTKPNNNDIQTQK